MQTKKKTILTSSAAIVAAAALLAGGTFAAWSDYDTVTGNNVGADYLELDLGDTSSSRFSNVRMAPGVANTIEREFIVASRNGDAVPNADLSLTLTNLLGTEDECSNANTEREDQLSIYGTSCDDADALYDEFGQFHKEAIINVNTGTVGPRDGACSRPRGGVRLTSSFSPTLQQLADRGSPVSILRGQTLAAGQGVCVAVAIQLPQGASNAVQGDSAEFDLRYDLTQITS